MYVIYVNMNRLGPVLMDAVLPIPPARFIDGNVTLGPVLMDVVLPIPPVGLMYKLLGPVLMDALLPKLPVII